MTTLKPYPEYRESGVPFLGDVPAAWSVQPAVTIARVLTSTVDKHSVEDQQSVALCNYTDVYYNDEIQATANFMKATASREQIVSYAVTAGDVVFTKDSETADDIGISAYVPMTLPGVVYGYHLSTYRPNDQRYGKFLKWLLDSCYAKATLQTRTLGVTRVGLSQNTVRYLRVPTPPPDEAALIAKFLDRETAEVDAFIGDQEELIGLLAERRAATISHAVTRGLDPTVPLKDSGVKWLGEVPTSWVVSRVKHAARILTGFAFKSEDFSDSEAAIRLLRGINVGVGKVDWALAVGWDQPLDTRLHDYMLELGDVVVGLDRPVISGGVRVARLTDVDVPSLLLQRVARLRGVRGNSSRFLTYALSAGGFAGYLAPLFTGVSVPHISPQQVGDFALAVPDVAEQLEIVEHLDREVAALDSAILDAREAIALSKERRAALISAAVTGKIDVRG